MNIFTLLKSDNEVERYIGMVSMMFTYSAYCIIVNIIELIII